MKQITFVAALALVSVVGIPAMASSPTHRELEKQISTLERERESLGIYNVDDRVGNQRRAELTRQIDTLENEMIAVDETTQAKPKPKKAEAPSVVVHGYNDKLGQSIEEITSKPLAPSPAPNTRTNDAGVGAAILILGSIILYFLPIGIATRRQCKASAGIGVINIFLGWTFIGWVAALAWAVSGETDSVSISSEPLQTLFHAETTD